MTAICLLAIVSGTYSQDVRKVNDEFKKFDALYLKGLKDYRIVGSSFMMVHDDQVVDKQFYGTAHIANGYPVDEDTIYHWASITKTLTGIAIMQLPITEGSSSKIQS